MSKYPVYLCLAVTLGALPTHEAGADWIGADELQASCDALLAADDDRDGSLCRAFVHGYLLGSDNARQSPSGTEWTSEPESFSERAVRTRVSPQLLQRVRSEQDVPYCLDEGLELREVVQSVADFISAHPNANEMDRGAILHQALVHHFPCDA